MAEGEGEGDNIVSQVLGDDVGLEHERRDDEEEGAYRKSIRESEGSEGNIGSPSRARETVRTECCAACQSKNRTNGRSCICQVPAKERRAPLGKLLFFLFSMAKLTVLLLRS